MALALRWWTEQGGMASNRADHEGMNATLAPMPFGTANTVRALMRDAPANCANEMSTTAREWALHGRRWSETDTMPTMLPPEKGPSWSAKATHASSARPKGFPATCVQRHAS